MDRYRIQILSMIEACEEACKEAYIEAWDGENLLKALRRNGILLEAACNGNGTCGKCGVQVLDEKALDKEILDEVLDEVLDKEIPVTAEARSFFSQEELARGYRLACQIDVHRDLKIRILQAGLTNMAQIQMPEYGIIEHKENHARKDSCAQMAAERTEYGIAVDLGSTTVAAVLIKSDGTVAAQACGVNPQRRYGADVISRIQASNESRETKEALQSSVCACLAQLFQTLLERACSHGQTAPAVSRIAIAGNTVMLHLLRGYSCETLGQAPFEPVNLELECLAYEDLFPKVPGCQGSLVYLLPGLSAFVGADIAAGLCSSGFMQTPKQELAVFVDLGTNGELAVGNQAGFVTASTAAGPAFEGGRLSCGVPGIPGAISKVSYLYHRVRIQTIGQQKPCGICGTGAVEAAAALLQEGYLDKTGLLIPELFESGMILSTGADGSIIRLTQADIREIQMAKAAIRAGMEVLLLRCREQEKGPVQLPVGRIYLAGGFGYYLSVDTAVTIGLFPPEWKEKITLCGNTSLKGAAAFLTDDSYKDMLAGLFSKNREIRLADDAQFQELYIQEMQFP